MPRGMQPPFTAILHSKEYCTHSMHSTWIS